MLKKIKGYDGVFAKRLRGLMAKNNEKTKTTQAELAKSLGVARQSVSQYMDGSVLPSVEKLNNIANFFDVMCDYLLGNTDVQSISTDTIAACQITGLSEEFVRYLNNGHPRKLEIINIMFKDSFIQNILSFIEDEIAMLIMEQDSLKNINRINMGEYTADYSYIDSYFNGKMQEIKIKVIDRCNQNIEKVLNDVFDLWSKKTIHSMSEETFNKAVKKSCLEYCLHNRMLLYRKELAKIHCESNDDQENEGDK